MAGLLSSKLAGLQNIDDDDSEKPLAPAGASSSVPLATSSVSHGAPHAEASLADVAAVQAVEVPRAPQATVAASVAAPDVEQGASGGDVDKLKVPQAVAPTGTRVIGKSNRNQRDDSGVGIYYFTVLLLHIYSVVPVADEVQVVARHEIEGGKEAFSWGLAFLQDYFSKNPDDPLGNYPRIDATTLAVRTFCERHMMV